MSVVPAIDIDRKLDDRLEALSESDFDSVMLAVDADRRWAVEIRTLGIAPIVIAVLAFFAVMAPIQSAPSPWLCLLWASPPIILLLGCIHISFRLVDWVTDRARIRMARRLGLIA